ncbi:MAG: cation transporter [Bdellovibrionales bacterium]|nr:cation transporter [Bdellovibrionales bacterium]
MSTAMTVEKRLLCPSCGKKGKRVSATTVRTLLKDEYASEPTVGPLASCEPTGNGSTGCPPLTGDTGWRFCDSPDCDVVYFAEDSKTIFTRIQLRVSVGVKEKTGERPLCYCFGHTVASIKKTILTTGRSDALEDIRAKMKDPGCRCETENPSGSCCLGSVAKGIKIAQEELDMNDSNVTPASPAKSATGRGEMIAKIGTVVSAIMASACCWLPLVLLAVGVSGAGAGAGIVSTLEAYRPLFMVVTFGFLGAAFYITYRPMKAVAEGGHGCCVPEATSGEACCAPAPKVRFSIMAFNKVMLWVVTVLAVSFLFFPKYVGFYLASQAGDNETTATSPLVSKTTIAIEGLTSEACSVALQKAIKGVPGVLGARVDFQKGQAVVSTEACCPLPKDRILKAIEGAGFTGSVTEAK